MRRKSRGLFTSLIAILALLLTLPFPARNEDLTNTRWRQTSEGLGVDLLFLEGKPGYPVRAAWVNPDGTTTLKYEGTYDGTTLVLGALDVNPNIGQKRTVTLTLSADRTRLTGTERENIPGRMDESFPAEFTRVGGPPLTGPGPGDSRPQGPGTGAPPPVGFDQGEGPAPLLIALIGGLIAAAAGAGTAGLVNLLTGRPGAPKPPQAPVRKPPQAQAGRPPEVQVVPPPPAQAEEPPAPPPETPPEGAEAPPEGAQPVPGAADVPPLPPQEKPPETPPAVPVIAAVPPQQPPAEPKKNRVLSVQLEAREIQPGAKRWKLTATVTTQVFSPTGTVQCKWWDWVANAATSPQPGSTEIFQREVAGVPGTTVTAEAWMDWETEAVSASCVLQSVSPRAVIEITVAKWGFGSARLTTSAGGSLSGTGSVIARHNPGGKPAEHPVADARWEAWGQSEICPRTFLGKGVTGAKGEYQVSLVPLLAEGCTGEGVTEWPAMELPLDGDAIRDFASYDDQAKRVPDKEAYQEVGAKCRGYSSECFRQLCASMETEVPKALSGLNLLRYAIGYVIIYKRHFAAHRERVKMAYADTFSSFIDAIITWTGIADWLWKWLTIPKKDFAAFVKKVLGWETLDSKLSGWAMRGVRWALWAAKGIVNAGAWVVEKALAIVMGVARPAALKLVEMARQHGGSFKGFEAGDLTRLVERLAKAAEDVRTRAAPLAPVPDADEVANGINLVLFKMVGAVVTVLVAMLCLAATLLVGYTLVIIVGLFFVLAVHKKMLAGSRSAVLSALEQALGNTAKVMYETMVGVAEKVPDSWITGRTLEIPYERFLPGVVPFDQSMAGELDRAYSKSLSRLVPADWKASAERVKQEEVEEATRFMDRVAIEEWAEWVSAWAKLLTKCAQAFFWAKSAIFNVRTKRLVAAHMAAQLGEMRFPPKIRELIDKALGDSNKYVEWGGVIEKWVNLVDYVVIWTPILVFEKWWLLSCEPSAKARIQGLYEIRTP